MLKTIKAQIPTICNFLGRQSQTMAIRGGWVLKTQDLSEIGDDQVILPRTN